MSKKFNSKEVKDFIKSDNEKSEEIIPVDFSVVEKYEKSELLAIEDPDTLIESVNNITETYKNFGEQFGIDIKYDVHSVSSTFKSILTSDAEEVFKIYLAKSFSKVRLSVFNKILISITTLVDRITQKEILESDNVEMSVGLVEKLIEMMEKINTIYAEVEIQSADTVLKQVSKNISMNKDKSSGNDLSNEEVMKVLRQIKNLKK